MKKYLFHSCLLLLFSGQAYSQSLIIKGRIKCLNPSVTTTKGAENILVVPTFLPAKSTITATRPSGYFEFNTGMPLASLQDKQINIYTVSRCTNCKEIVRRVFISEDQDRQNKADAKSYVTVKDWTLNTTCKVAELSPFSADSLLRIIAKQQSQDLDKVSSSTALLGTPAFLNFLTNIVTVAGVIPGGGQFFLDKLGEGDIAYGQLLFSSPMIHTGNTGFNFSPSRDFSEAALWNASSMVFSRKANNISLFTNLKNNGKLSAFGMINEKLSVGIGAIYTKQDELRHGDFSDFNNNPNSSDSLQMKLKEYAGFLSAGYKINKRFSIGITGKSIWQNFNVPYRIDVQPGQLATFRDTTNKRQAFDADLSFTYKFSPSFQAGLSAMNLLGIELYSDAFPPGQKPTIQNQRSFGLGLCYKYMRWNIGTDVL
ncbi:MAG: hypothetical protein EOO10_20235, partial [Chitinophagaceae bacterium]